MQQVTLPVETIGVQLMGDHITTPVEIHLDKEAVTLRVYSGADQHNFEIAVVGSRVRLVRRSMVNGQLNVTAEILHDFSA